MASSRLASSVALALSLALLPGRAAVAQQPEPPSAEGLATARTLYKEGKELRDKGDLQGALKKFEAAHALGQTPVTGIELARTYAELRRLVEAREMCLWIGRVPVAPDETSKSADARAEAARLAQQLEPRIANLTVRIVGAMPEEPVHLVVDGVKVPDVALHETLRVNPGRREVFVSAGTGEAAREAHTYPELAEGDTREITITLPAPPASAASEPVPPEPAPPPPPPSAAPTLIRLGFGTAIAGAAAGLMAGAVAWQKQGQLDTVGHNECPISNGCAAALDDARHWATAANVSLGIGAAGAALGVIGLLVQPRHRDETAPGAQALRVEPWIGPGTVGVHADF
jgi:hypothetical protein